MSRPSYETPGPPSLGRWQGPSCSVTDLQRRDIAGRWEGRGGSDCSLAPRPLLPPPGVIAALSLPPQPSSPSSIIGRPFAGAGVTVLLICLPGRQLQGDTQFTALPSSSASVPTQTSRHLTPSGAPTSSQPGLPASGLGEAVPPSQRPGPSWSSWIQAAPEARRPQGVSPAQRCPEPRPLLSSTLGFPAMTTPNRRFLRVGSGPG